MRTLLDYRLFGLECELVEPDRAPLMALKSPVEGLEHEN